MNCTRIVSRVITCATWFACAAAQAGIITVIAGEPTSKRDALRVSAAIGERAAPPARAPTWRIDYLRALEEDLPRRKRR